MIPPIIQAKIFSKLGSSSSLAPLALKDITNSIGLTTGSYITGKEEGEDRFIDEFGTEALWLLGIPGYKGIINLAAFLPQKLDYNFDARNFRNPELKDIIINNAPNELKDKIKKVYQKEKTYKNLSTAKFGLAVSLAIATYIGLTKCKQKYTDKNIRENILAEYAEEQKLKMEQKAENKPEKENKISFTGIGKAIQDFACDPVKNMWLLDAGISSERILDSRGTQERIGYIFKEGSFFFFMYYFGKVLQDKLENRAKKVYNKTIGFDSRVIESPEFRAAFESNNIAKDLENFGKIITVFDDKADDAARMAEEVNIHKFIHANKDNLVVKTAMKSDLISSYKKLKSNLTIKDILSGKLFEKTGEIDTRKYIDIENLKNHYNNLKNLLKEYNSRNVATESSEQFFNTLKRLKRGAIINNIGSSILVLGVITPTIMVVKRLLSPNDKEFCRKTEIRNQLIKEGKITA